MQQWLTNQLTMSDASLGSLIQKPEIGKKDAIHVAIMQVKSSDRFLPGEHVGLNDKGEAAQVENPIGIVDPLLKRAVEPGDVFWMCMYPKTITNLRHDWNHPVVDAIEQAKKLEAETQKEKEKENEEDFDDGCSGCN